MSQSVSAYSHCPRPRILYPALPHTSTQGGVERIQFVCSVPLLRRHSSDGPEWGCHSGHKVSLWQSNPHPFGGTYRDAALQVRARVSSLHCGMERVLVP